MNNDACEHESSDEQQVSTELQGGRPSDECCRKHGLSAVERPDLRKPGGVKRKRGHPPVYLLACIEAMFALHHLLPVRQIVRSPYRYVGIVAVVLGLGLDIWAALLFKKRSTRIKPFRQPSYMIAEGPFRFSRNPIYLGMTLLLVGVAVFMGSITPPLAIPAFMLIVAAKFIRPEERTMEETFGEDYRRYAKRVRRWI